MKTKKLLLSALSLITCLTLSGCSNNQAKGVKFVTSCYPIYVIALNLTKGIDDVEVCSMSSTQTGCLHDYQLQTDDMKNIEKSTAFIINGAGMETFLNKLVHEVPKVKIIDSSININLLIRSHHHHDEHCHDEHCHDEHCHDEHCHDEHCHDEHCHDEHCHDEHCHDEHCHDEHCHDEHCHDEPNAHIWTSPENYIAQIENITRGLQIVDEKNKEKYNENAKEYIEKIKKLQQEIKKESSNFKNVNVLTLHDFLPYFAHEFGINIVGVIGSENHGDTTTKNLAQTINEAKKHNVKAILTDSQYSSEAANTVAKEINAKVFVLNSGVTGEKDLDAYLNAMHSNLEILKQALN